jgi:hypothetical protein
MWGDYHVRELALMILREAESAPYLAFFNQSLVTSAATRSHVR